MRSEGFFSEELHSALATASVGLGTVSALVLLELVMSAKALATVSAVIPLVDFSPSHHYNTPLDSYLALRWGERERERSEVDDLTSFTGKY